MPTIKKLIECKSCSGTGVYQGMAEGHGCGVVCTTCKGSGAFEYTFTYNEFKGKRTKDGISRVYKSGYGYKIGLGKINFVGIGEIDMDKKGVSYTEFLSGQMPAHIQELCCPMLADQGACHAIDGFVQQCKKLDGRGWIGHIPNCNYASKKSLCWDRFTRAQKAQEKN